MDLKNLASLAGGSPYLFSPTPPFAVNNQTNIIKFPRGIKKNKTFHPVSFRSCNRLIDKERTKNQKAIINIENSHVIESFGPLLDGVDSETAPPENNIKTRNQNSMPNIQYFLPTLPLYKLVNQLPLCKLLLGNSSLTTVSLSEMICPPQAPQNLAPLSNFNPQ